MSGNMSTRQSFLTSQNPLLMDYIPFNSPLEVRQSLISCKVDPGNGYLMFWTNISEADAISFFDAYSVDVQHVSEILRTKGLW